MQSQFHRLNVFVRFLQRGLIFAAVFALAATGTANAAVGDWTWVKGSNTINAAGSYGTKTVANPSNMPPGLVYPSTWVDSDGDFWMFGGVTLTGYSNALWRWDETNWTWMNGSSTLGDAGNYGTKGVTNPSNVPRARGAAASWQDSSGNVWIFGGVGGSIPYPLLNDLWKWDGTNWTWISGSDSANAYGMYGVKGVADPGNVPGARYGGANWIDTAGNLWLFGGYGYSTASSSAPRYLQDLWKWDGTHWTWVSGADSPDHNGVYGTLNTPDPANIPGARSGMAFWTDAAGDLWLFGGRGYDEADPTYAELNDLWKWNIATGQWTWVKGASDGIHSSVYGTQGVAAPANTPGSRELSSVWVDAAGDVWLLGGWCCLWSGPPVVSLGDLWKWDGTDWVWMRGPTGGNQNGTYGTQGIPASANVPGGRYGSGTFVDGDSNLWLFGGAGYAATGTSLGAMNDLWMYDLDVVIPDPVPADLVVNLLEGPMGYGTTNPAAGDDVTFRVSALNQGEMDTQSDSTIKLYYVPLTPLTNPMPTDLTGPGASPGVVQVGSATVPGLLSPGTSSPPAEITFEFPDGGTYYLYAVVDANYVLDEAGTWLPSPDPARETNNVSAPLSVLVSAPEADLVLRKVVDNPAAAPGEQVNFTISLTNLGGSTATSIQLTDLLPAPLTFVSANAYPGSYSDSTGQWTIPNLAVGGTATLVIRGGVPIGTAIGTVITNTVTSLTMSPSVNDPDRTNDIFCTNGCKSATVVVGAINLSLEKTVSDATPNENPSGTCPTTGPTNCFTYTLTVRNLSPVTAATNVTIVDTLPSGITYRGANGACTAVSRTVTCAVGSLAPMATVVRTLTVYANAGTGGQTLNNTATVSATEADPDLSNNTSSVSVRVEGPDLEVTQTVTPLYASTAQLFTWTVRVKNVGPVTVTNVVVQDTMPVSALNPTITVTPSTGTWTSPNWTIPSLASGATATMTIRASAQSNQDGNQLSNYVALVSSLPPDTNMANDAVEATVSITSEAAADLELTAVATPNIALAGSVVTYSYTVTNNGPWTAHGVTITDTTISSNTTTSSTTSIFNYVPPIPATWNTATGQFIVGSLLAGQSKTYTLTLALVNTPAHLFVSTPVVAATTPPELDYSNDIMLTTLLVITPGRALSLSDSGIDFGEVLAGSASEPMTIMITSVGTDPTTIGTLVKSGSDDFTIGNDTCGGVTLDSVEACTFEVTFSPGGLGEKTGQITIPNDAPGGTLTVDLTGSGVQPEIGVTPAAHDFGNVTVGSSNGAFSFTVENTGTGMLYLGTLSKSGSSDFTLDSTLCNGAALAANETCTFDVTFSPSASGAVSGSVSIPSNAPGSPASVTFSGIGSQPVVTLSETSHDFGSIAAGLVSPPHTFTITNGGDGDLTFADFSVAGDFAVGDNTCGVTLAPGASCMVGVVFNPMSAGALTGSLSITTNASPDPAVITLAGTGVNAGTPPKLSTPKNGAAIYTHTPKLTWKKQKNVITYHLLLLDINNPSSPQIVIDQDVNGTYLVTPDLPFGTYQWQVRMLTAGGWSAYSAPRTFQVTLNKTPKNLAKTGTHRPKFTWLLVTGATYRLRIFTNPNDIDASIVLDESGLTLPRYTVPLEHALASGQYYWQVSIDDGGLWTPAWGFTIR